MPENADNKSVTWASSNTEIATINQNGLVTAIKEGTATITVTTQDGGKVATCQVVVKPKPIEVAEIALTPTELILTENGTATLTATISPENATNQAVTWASSNTEIATIDANGLVTAIKEGTATITATTQDGGKVATCIVNVEPAVPYITMVTQKNIGEDIRFVIKVANEADKTDVWIDLNNNGKKDTDEDKVVFLNKDKITHQDYSSYRLQSQTITLYGKVTSLYCGGNQLTQLDVSKNTQLINLFCSGNQLTQLDVSKNTQLIDLFCSGNQLTQLDVSKNTQLTNLICFQNQLTQLDVSKNTKLIWLNCDNNKLTQLDVSKNAQLTYLLCNDNQLTQLDVSKNTELTSLSCAGNQLTQLDVSKNTQLEHLNCSRNQLTQLDVSKNTQLIGLQCHNNKLTQLNGLKSEQLKGLNCTDNQLTQLDISKNTQLIRLDCGKNQLAQLDASKNIQLSHLECQKNQLIGLKIPKNTQLQHLDCSKNQLSQEAVDRLIDDLPMKERRGTPFSVILIDNKDGTDGNYQFITNAQKQKARQKNWTLWRYINEWKIINP